MQFLQDRVCFLRLPQRLRSVRFCLVSVSRKKVRILPSYSPECIAHHKGPIIRKSYRATLMQDEPIARMVKESYASLSALQQTKFFMASSLS